MTWYVKVLFEGGYVIATHINGTYAQVRDYYARGKVFNLGTVYDDMRRVKRILDMQRI